MTELVNLVDNVRRRIYERPRNFRPRIHPFQEYDAKEFRNRYRLTFMADLVREQLIPVSVQQKNISIEMQLLITLRFFAKVEP